MIDYRKHAFQAFLAGALMCLVSRLSHILVKPGTLRHESYMAMYAYLFTACIMPIFVLSNMRMQNEVRKAHSLDDVSVYAKVIGFAVLFLLLLVKNFHMERGIMKRFVEDYDPEVHENFPCFGRSDDS